MINKILTTPRSGMNMAIPGAPGLQVGGGIAGFASKVEAPSIKIYNERQKYNEWEFVYDMKKDKRMLGQAAGQQQGMTNNQNPLGNNSANSPQSSFGNNSQSSFGNNSQSSFGNNSQSPQTPGMSPQQNPFGQPGISGGMNNGTFQPPSTPAFPNSTGR